MTTRIQIKKYDQSKKSEQWKTVKTLSFIYEPAKVVHIGMTRYRASTIVDVMTGNDVERVIKLEVIV